MNRGDGHAPVVVVGDVFVDRDITGVAERLCPDGPAPVVEYTDERSRVGGAGLAATLVSRCTGRPVQLITALADDARGRLVREQLAASGIQLLAAPAGPTVEKARVMVGGRVVIRVDRDTSVPPRVDRLPDAALDAIGEASAVLVSDYGRGMAADARLREALRGAVTNRPVVWDPHPRGSAAVVGSALTTPNRREVASLMSIAAVSDDAMVAAAERLRHEWKVDAVAITLGSDGALLVDGERLALFVPARPVEHVDPCGAGDRFAAAAVSHLANGVATADAVVAAVEEATRFLERGGVAQLDDREQRAAPSWPSVSMANPRFAPAWRPALEVAGAIRASGGRVVAAGGCFDLLHAGHVRLLRQARGLGDGLVVCLNSDDSVRRLKGPGRPLVTEHDRAALLEALECVDGVAVFDEATPVQLLEALQPDLFVKGADYADVEMPEAEAMARWSGRVVTLPHLPGRSTTQLVKGAERCRSLTTMP